MNQYDRMEKGYLGKIVYYLLHATGFVLLYFILKDFDWQGFSQLFASFKIWDFIFGFILLIMVYIIKSFRWLMINSIFGIRINYGTTLIFFIVSGFLSVITPGRLGEFSRIFFIRRKTSAPAAIITSSVVLDRIWDILVLSLLGGISFIMIFGGFDTSALTIVLTGALFLIAIAIILFPSLVFVPLLYLFRKKGQLKDDLEKVHTDWKSNALRLFFPGFFTTLTAFLLLALIPLIFTSRIGQDIGIIHSVSAVSISNMLAFLPVTIGGFGTRELVFSEVWKILEHSTESAITISTAYFICNYLGSMVLGGLSYLIWFRKHFRLKEISTAE